MARPGYSAFQIQEYYNRINLPASFRHEPGTASVKIASQTSSGLEFLSALQRHSLATIPFENLDLHYSFHHSISIDAESLFEKQVGRKNGRGGYCMENNAVFANVLRGLGFNVISTGARISNSVGGTPLPLDQVNFSGWSHMINIISFSDAPDKKYFADVGFGSGCSVTPIPLIHDEQGKMNIEPNQWVRLRHVAIPGTAGNQPLWVFERKNGNSDYSPCYCFGELEFLESDFKVMNHWTSTSTTSWFTYAPVCVKMILDGEEVVGDKQIFKGSYKKRVKGEIVDSRELESEEERIELLEKEFSILLDEGERNGIKGMVSALS